MLEYLGILFALLALLSWGFGDFLIQKTTRMLGTWQTILAISCIGFVGLFPFVKDNIASLSMAHIGLLLLLSAVTLFATVFDYQALKQGKISIIEPLLGMELPITVGLGMLIGSDTLAPLQLVLIATIFVGMVLVVTKETEHLAYHKRIVEKGVMLAGIGAVGMGLTNFLVGTSSQEISPLMTIWFVHSLVGVIAAIALARKRALGDFFRRARSHGTLVLGLGILDNLAWVSFGIATTHVPISIATAISESYIALAALLGIYINKERLKRHQFFGVAVVIICLVFLSAASPD